MTEVVRSKIFLTEGKDRSDAIVGYYQKWAGASITPPEHGFRAERISRVLEYDPATISHSQDPNALNYTLRIFKSFEATQKNIDQLVPQENRLGLATALLLDINHQFKVLEANPEANAELRNLHFLSMPYLVLRFNASQIAANFNLPKDDYPVVAAHLLKGELQEVLEKIPTSNSVVKSNIKKLYAALALYDEEILIAKIEKEKDGGKEDDKFKAEVRDEYQVAKLNNLLSQKSIGSEVVGAVSEFMTSILKENTGSTVTSVELYENLCKVQPRLKPDEMSFDILSDDNLKVTLTKLTQALLLTKTLSAKMITRIDSFVQQVPVEPRFNGINQVLGKALDLIRNDIQDAVLGIRDDKFHFDDKRAWEGIQYPSDPSGTAPTPKHSSEFLAAYKVTYGRIFLDILELGTKYTGDK